MAHLILFFSRCERQENFFKLAGIAALFAEFVTVANGNQFSAVDDANTVGHFLGDAQLVRRNQHGHARK
jgi:hypothetical protein